MENLDFFAMLLNANGLFGSTVLRLQYSTHLPLHIQLSVTGYFDSQDGVNAKAEKLPLVTPQPTCPSSLPWVLCVLDQSRVLDSIRV